MADRRRFAALVLVGFCVGCPDCSPAAGDDAATGDAGAEDASADGGNPALVAIQIFHTGDEHGWLQPTIESGSVSGGAANVAGWWRDVEGRDPARSLILSGGDTWMGPAISSWFDGEPAVAALNAMGYTASALGNHEFDLGRDVLLARLAQASYRYLAANIYLAGTDLRPDWLAPYLVVDVAGVAVGIIGIITTDTAWNTVPANVRDLRFEDPAATLAALVPEVRAAGAEIVIVLGHAGMAELAAAVSQSAVAVDLVYGAHSHAAAITDVDGVVAVNSGIHWRRYSVVDLVYDRDAHAVVSAVPRLVVVSYPDGEPNPVAPDPAVVDLVAGWQLRTDQALAEPIGYTESGLENQSWLLANWVTDAWRWAYPDVDVAVQNFGGLRQGVPSGTITIAQVVDVMPFDNLLVELEITGAQLRETLQAARAQCFGLSGCGAAVSGLSYRPSPNGLEVTLSDGTGLDDGASYRVLTNDFLATGGASYPFVDQDPTPIEYGVNYREPVIGWTRSLQSAASAPLEHFLDPLPRNR